MAEVMAVVVSTNEPPSGGWVSLLTRTSDHGLNNWLYKRLHILLISWLHGFSRGAEVGAIIEIAPPISRLAPELAAQHSWLPAQLVARRTVKLHISVTTLAFQPRSSAANCSSRCQNAERTVQDNSRLRSDQPAFQRTEHFKAFCRLLVNPELPSSDANSKWAANWWSDA